MTEFKVGDLVRKKNSTKLLLIQGINPTPFDEIDFEDENWAELTNADGMGYDCVDGPDELTLFMSKEEADNRQLPTEYQIAQEVASAMHSVSVSFRVSETFAPDSGYVEVNATTDTGLPFTFIIKVSDVYPE